MECNWTTSNRCTKCYLIDTMNSLNQCFLCHSSCKTCNGALSNNCLTCYDDFLILNPENTCVRSCPSSTYYEIAAKRCTTCAYNCKECIDKFDTSCTICKEGFVFVSNYCQLDCGQGYFYNTVSNQCELCHPTCKTCSTSSTATSCITCLNGKEKMNGLCVNICKEA